MSAFQSRRDLLLRTHAWISQDPKREGLFYVGLVLAVITVILWIAFGS